MSATGVADPLVLRVRESGGERTVQLATDARIGRHAGAEIALQDPGVSRAHAQLTRAGQTWLIADAGSRNGTLLNGVRLLPGQQVVLHAGDVVQVGGVSLVVAGDGVPTTTPPMVGAQPTMTLTWKPPAGEALAAPPASSPTATWQGATGQLRSSTTPTVDPVPTSRSTPVTDGGAMPRWSFGAPAPGESPPPRRAGAGHGVVRVGRAIDNDIAIADPSVASYHLDAWLTPQGLVVRDLTGGRTMIDGRLVVEGTVHPDASISLGGFMLPARAVLERASAATLPGQQPRPVPELEHLLVARGVVRRVGDRTILRGVDFAVRRGQFICVAGASGAGKSTLMSILNGYVAPDDGIVEVVRNADGEPDLGYVPQDDIIHRNLSLRDAVVMSAVLRYPPGTPLAQVEARADEVLTELGLREHAATRVDRLSGGQRKRASVALELMTRPRLLLLDEPTSGLDPASDRRLIALLGALADSGYGIVLITHTTANIDACDTVAFLAPGGHLVFWGSPQEARRYFGCSDLEEVYERLEEAQYGTPEQWRQRFEGSTCCPPLREEVAAGLQEFEQLRNLTGTQPSMSIPFGAAAAATAPVRRPGLGTWQLKGLARRYLKTILADRRTLLFTVAQAPAIVILAALIFPSDSLTASPNPFNPGPSGSSCLSDANPLQCLSDHAGKGVQLLFLLGCTLVWLGTFNACREICKETAIWQRERHAGVRPGPYLMSKFLVLGGLCLVQVVLWVALIAIIFGFPDGGGLPGFFVVGLATAISGVALGLAVSAAMPNPDRAMTMVPLVMIPQLIFAGAIISLAEMGGVGQAISAVFSGRWVFEGLGRLVDSSDRFLDPGTNFQTLSSTVADRGFDGSAAGPFFALVLLTVGFGAIALWLVRTRGLPRGSHQARMRLLPATARPPRWQPVQGTPPAMGYAPPPAQPVSSQPPWPPPPGASGPQPR